jgi:hypothetical protein
MVEPILLGGGKTIFPSDGMLGHSTSHRSGKRRPAC